MLGFSENVPKAFHTQDPFLCFVQQLRVYPALGEFVWLLLKPEILPFTQGC